MSLLLSSLTVIDGDGDLDGDEDGEDSGSFVEEQYDRSTVLRMYQESQERDLLFEDDE